ncbi:hypothetical protein HDA32_005036 [Spinactinospora alkalitolerans]|uniref:Uncharacterized protein n=1 Tax=Spinactinospora alkalitolerans TaxID=687207 RepID=A0A852TZB7_9ACTN|nr:delta-60 repeat domain-containing protein [Spinactinospora alkalitolerans]NYE49916.1 hypothetical protein [Spinactinospora alkalitolerans]
MPRTRRTRPLLATALGALALTALGPLTPTANAGLQHAAVVSDRPVGWTPHVLDGSVKDILRVGDTIVVGGDFSRVSDFRGNELRRTNLFAFEHDSGRIIHDFAPRTDGTVVSLAPGPDGTVYAGGAFTSVNGHAQRGIARLSVSDGDRDADFGARLDDGAVSRLESHGDLLYVGGSFGSVNGQERTGLARLDSGGDLDRDFDITIAGARRWSLRLEEIALSPAGDRLVINGTFTEVEGERRPQIAMIRIGSDGARLGDWSTEAFAAECSYERTNTYMRQMDFAPDGSYFTVVTSGGPDKKPGLCKTVTRWEADDRPGARPTWANHTGGDAIYSVEVTGAAVYVGGHQRWMDNPEGDKSAGPGAAPREGIAAVDPETGKALAWNPGRTRGHGVEALTATPEGLYVGSDTKRLAGEYHARLGMFPLD